MIAISGSEGEVEEYGEEDGHVFEIGSELQPESSEKKKKPKEPSVAKILVVNAVDEVKELDKQKKKKNSLSLKDKNS